MEVISKEDLIAYIKSKEGVETYLNKGIKGLIHSLPFGEYKKKEETCYIKMLMPKRDLRYYRCSRCGQSLKGDENYCGYCGRKIVGVG